MLNKYKYIITKKTINMEPFTHDDFKAMKKAFGLNNKLISEIIGIAEFSVKNQTQPSKMLPTWAKAMIYVFKNPAVDLEAKNQK